MRREGGSLLAKRRYIPILSLVDILVVVAVVMVLTSLLMPAWQSQLRSGKWDIALQSAGIVGSFLTVLVIGSILRFVVLAVLDGLVASVRSNSFLRRLELFAFLLPRPTRERVFDPSFNDLCQDYLLARRKRGVWARRWLAIAMVFQAALLLIACMRALLMDNLLWMLPAPIRQWITGPR